MKYEITYQKLQIILSSLFEYDVFFFVENIKS